MNQPPGTRGSDNVPTSTTDRARYRDEQNNFDNADATVISDDYHIQLDRAQDRTGTDSVQNSFAPASAIDRAAMTLDDFVRYTQNQDVISDNLALRPFLEGESVLVASRQASPNLKFASASSTPPHCSNNSSMSSSSSQQMFQFNAGGIQESMPSPDSAKSSASETLHSRLVAVHYQLTTLSESLAVSFNMAKDVEKNL